MRIYHAGLTREVLVRYHALHPSRKLNVLFSHGRPNKEAHDFHTKHRRKVNSLVLDSGTWTLHSSKKERGINITRETYLDYVKEFGDDHYDFYFNFDEDYDKDGFYTNDRHQKFLEAAGLKPVPVIRDIDGDEVNYYVQKGHEMIAIGSRDRGKPEKISSIVWRLFKKGIKVHLFGTTRFEYLIDAPVFSCDSSNWPRTGKDNDILFWNEENKQRDKRDKIGLETYAKPVKKKSKMYMSYENKLELDEYLEKELQLTYTDLLGANNFLNRRVVNIHYFVRLEELITAHHKKEFGIKW